MISGFPAGPGSRRDFEGMLVARREITTRSLGQPKSPAGRGLKHASAAFIARDGMYAGFAS